MAMSAAPAGAWFRSLNQQKTETQVKLTNTTFTGGGATVTCQSAFGEGKIQTEGNWWEQNENGKQLKTTNGPHLRVQIKQWNNCKAKTSLGSNTATVTPCEFQLKQPNKGELTATADVTSVCIIQTGALKCTITVPTGTHSGGNEGLKTVTGENGASSILATANVAGIFGEESGSCTEKFSNGTFVSESGGLRALGFELN